MATQLSKLIELSLKASTQEGFKEVLEDWEILTSALFGSGLNSSNPTLVIEKLNSLLLSYIKDKQKVATMLVSLTSELNNNGKPVQH